MRWWSAACAVMIATLANEASAQCPLTWSPGPALPSGRTGAAMVYDAARGRAVLVGGTTSDGTVSNAVYEFDGSSWINAGSTGAPRRTGHAMAYDSDRHVVVLFGGTSTPPSGGSSRTYEYDGVAWREIATPTTPPGRRWHAMAYDTARHVVVMHGGVTASGVASDTWEYNGVTWTPRQNSPGPRCQHAMAYDPVQQRVVIASGLSTISPAPLYAASSWAWNGVAWTEVAGSAPPDRTGAAMAYSPVSQRLLLSGGTNSTGFAFNAFELGPQGWTNANITGSSPGRTEACLTFHQGVGGFLLAAGTGSAGYPSEAWLLAGGGGVAFISGPQPQQVFAGSEVTFIAAVSGSPTGWQWRRGGAPLSNSARITGAQSSTLVIQGVTTDDQGLYDVIATSTCGPVTSNAAALTVVPPCGNSDFNGDDDVGTDQDIEAFFACLGGNCCASCYPGGSDFNADGDAGTDQDIESFFRVLGGGPC